MKQRKRIMSFLLAGCLAAGLMPTGAFAAGTDTGKTIQFGTSGISGYDSTNGYDYIYYGTWDSSAIKWRVLDDQTNTGGSGLFLLSDVLLGTGDYGDVYFNNSGIERNVWEDSSAREWCKDFSGEEGAATNVTNAFTEGELSAVLATTKSDPAYTSRGIEYPASENILNDDKVFFLSAEEAENSAYGFIDKNARVANYGTGAGEWWLRSPLGFSASDAGLVNSYGSVSFDDVFDAWAARPAFNLNLNSVLFTSAAVGGKIPAANGGGEQGGAAAGGIFEIPTASDDTEWKLTLLDGSRSFAVVEKAAKGMPGGTVALNYSGATVGANEYISVMIEGKNGITHYGRVAQPASPSGTVEMEIPADLVDGEYSLHVFSEQYNGGEKDDTKLTDYASPFATVSFTVEHTTHSWAEAWSSDEGYHWKECKNCDYGTEDSAKEGYAAHSGGTATCKEPASCSVCGQPYGELDKSKHTDDTEIRGRVEPTVSSEGYTGDTYCKDCDTKIRDGESIPKVTPPGDNGGGSSSGGGGGSSSGGGGGSSSGGGGGSSSGGGGGSSSGGGGSSSGGGGGAPAANVIVGKTENGKVTTGTTYAEKDTMVTITVTPDPGYEIGTVKAIDSDGKEVKVMDKGDGQYTFIKADKKVTISVDFIKIEAAKAAEITLENVDRAKAIILSIDKKETIIFGKIVLNDVAPIIRNERTMLPIRIVAEALGGKVVWNAAERKVTITKGEQLIEIVIDSSIAYVNGKAVQLDASAFIESSRTYLPLRFVAENLDATVLWDANARQVIIVPKVETVISAENKTTEG